MTRVVGMMPLHYGAPYIQSAIRSVIEHVDKFYVLYTPVGSFGHTSDTPLPEGEDEANLHHLAAQAAGDKLLWFNGRWGNEGEHRDAIRRFAADADIVIPVDSDELFTHALLDDLLRAARDNPDVHRWRVPMCHAYKSFYWWILHDPAYPHRLYNMRAYEGEATVDTPHRIAHLGYAIPNALMRAKWRVHGHKAELRRDCDYFTDVYEANRRTDCHPCGNTAWNAEYADPFAQGWMPDWMKQHAFAGKDVIE